MKQAEVDVASDEERRQILKGISDNLNGRKKSNNTYITRKQKA